MGGTGNLPVPVGNLPTGMTNDRVPSERTFWKNCSPQSSAGGTPTSDVGVPPKEHEICGLTTRNR